MEKVVRIYEFNKKTGSKKEFELMNLQEANEAWEYKGRGTPIAMESIGYNVGKIYASKGAIKNGAGPFIVMDLDADFYEFLNLKKGKISLNKKIKDIQLKGSSWRNR